MRKKEFLEELKYTLEGRAPDVRIDEILAHYGELFEKGLAAGKTEDEVSAQLGSPARLGRAVLLEDEEKNVSSGREQKDILGNSGRSQKETLGNGGWGETVGPGGNGRERKEAPENDGWEQERNQRQYTSFQKKVNRTAESISERVLRPDPGVAARPLATMGRRLGAWMIDCFLVFAAVFVLTAFFILILHISGGSWAEFGHHAAGHRFYYGLSDKLFGFLKNIMYGSIPIVFAAIYSLILVITMMFSTLCLWLTDGYTPGKWLLKIRVVKLSGEKLRFLDALFREFLIKGLANDLLNGLLNVASFIWGCATKDHKTVQDLAAQTTVVVVR